MEDKLDENDDSFGEISYKDLLCLAELKLSLDVINL